MKSNAVRHPTRQRIIMTDEEFTIIESRNAKLILENRRLNSEVDKLREEKQLMYTDLLRLRITIDEHFDHIAKTFFADDFYED